MTVSAVSDRDLALLNAHFVAPFAMGMMLDGVEPFDDAAETALHDLLHDHAPDTGLLCLALCVQQVAGHMQALPQHPPIARTLLMVAERIIDDYAAALMAEDNRNHPARLSDRDALALLAQVPEDLEELSDLLDATIDSGSALLDDHTLPMILCDVLSLQAHHHRERALGDLRDIAIGPAAKPAAPVRPRVEYIDDNVIAFPR